jgi:hypothetical protein
MQYMARVTCQVWRVGRVLENNYIHCVSDGTQHWVMSRFIQMQCMPRLTCQALLRADRVIHM